MKREAEGHPWAEFLAARARVIAWLRSEGRTPTDIARELSMDTEQVRQILAYVDSVN